MLAQLQYELAVNRDSCISLDVESWYNSLYSELSDFDDDRYRENGCGSCEVDQDGLLDVLQQFTIEQIQDILVSYFVSQLTGLPQDQINNFLNTFRDAVRNET